jgi:hypothetical protein
LEVAAGSTHSAAHGADAVAGRSGYFIVCVPGGGEQQQLAVAGLERVEGRHSLARAHAFLDSWASPVTAAFPDGRAPDTL